MNTRTSVSPPAGDGRDQRLEEALRIIRILMEALGRGASPEGVRLLREDANALDRGDLQTSGARGDWPETELMRAAPGLSPLYAGLVGLRYGLLDGHIHPVAEVAGLFGLPGARVVVYLEDALQELRANADALSALPLVDQELAPSSRLLASVASLDVGPRARLALSRAGIHNVGDLLRTTGRELMSIEGVGRATLERIELALSVRGLRLDLVRRETRT